jgi:hypothetical protein
MPTQDRKRLNRNEDYEVRYEAKTRGVSKAAVKRASKAAGPMRKKIDARLKRGKHSAARAASRSRARSRG